MKRLGVITIGQSPRVDLVPEMVPLLGGVEVVERGALDGLDAEGLARLTPRGPGSEVLTSRLADGEPVVLDHDAVHGLVQTAVADLEARDVDATLLMCTGHFPPMAHRLPLLLAEPLFVGGARALLHGTTRLGVITPLEEQRAGVTEKWEGCADVVMTAVATPYARDASPGIIAASERLRDMGADALVLDCMGYSEAMRSAARHASGLMVLLARSVVARLAGEAVAEPPVLFHPTSPQGEN